MKTESSIPVVEQDSQAIGMIDVGEAHSVSASIDELLRRALERAPKELSWSIELGFAPHSSQRVERNQPTPMMTSMVLVFLEGKSQHLLRAKQTTESTANSFQRNVIWLSQDSTDFRDLKNRWFSRN